MMETEIDPGKIYVVSPDVVAREIEGELIIVPLTSGIGDMEDELYTLNETGRSIWQKLDGRSTLSDIVKSLENSYQDASADLEKDVTGFVSELLRRRIIIEV